MQAEIIEVMKRRLLLVLVSLLPMLASAYDAEINGIYYNFSGDEATITYLDYNSSDNSKAYSGAVHIPESVLFEGKTYNVTGIGQFAFYYCDKLTSVTIPNSIKIIGNSAFWGCSGLTSITIPNSVTTIEDNAFWCVEMTSVNINDLTAWCNITFEDFDSNPLDVGTHCNLLLNGEEITDLIIPDDVTIIRDYAFNHCENLTSVTIHEGVTSIGKGAFFECYDLTSVTIPNSVTTIGSWAFQYCTSLISLTIGNGVTSIGENAFRMPGSSYSNKISVKITDMSAWCRINFQNEFSNPLSHADHFYLNGEEITDLIIPDDVITIRNYAFSRYYGLTSVTIPNSVTSIGSWAFQYCYALTSLTIGDNVKIIGLYA